MNATRIGLASLAVLLTLGGLIASAQVTTCIPSSGGQFCAISQNADFQAAYGIQQSNLIFSGVAISNLGTWITANIGGLLILAIVIGLVFAIWDRVYRK
jgi:hypothetical protein